MREHRHPHPHVDPRQPRQGTRPGTNPPVFAWKPIDGAPRYRLQVTHDPEFETLALDLELDEPLHLPEKAFASGRYLWRWSAGESVSETFEFEITPDAVTLEVPSAEEWLRRFPDVHPRLYLRPEDVPELRASRTGARATLWADLVPVADGCWPSRTRSTSRPTSPTARSTIRPFSGYGPGHVGAPALCQGR